jgi:hypothetical protein
MEKNNFAQGVFITERISKAGKPYLSISVKEGDTYVCHLAFAKTVNDQVSYFSMRNEEPQQIIDHLLGLIQTT